MTTLKEEEPFAFVGDTEVLSQMCSFCFAYEKKFNKCRSCHVLYYCNKDCQKRDWVNHKKECLLLKKAKESSKCAIPDATVRLVARILLKSETALAQKSFNGRSWEDLDNSLEDVKAMGKAFVKKFDQIVDFMKPLQKVDEDEILWTLSKVQNHKIDIYHNRDYGSVFGYGIYLGFSVHKHSCVPDSQLIFNGTKASLRCFDQTKTKYSTDLTLNYNAITPWNPFRKPLFKLKYFRECTCPLCVDENHIFNRMGSSCRVSCCMDAVGILDENSSGPYRCNKCGEASTITVAKVECAVSRIQEFLVKKTQSNYTLDLVEIKRLVHESEKILSVYNSYFIHLCDFNAFTEYSTLPKNDDDQLFIRQLNDKRLKAYSCYLNEMDVRMALALLDRIVLKLVLDSADGYNVSTALDAVERALGEEHPALLYYEKMLDDFKRVNEKKRDELFREAANFKW